MKFSFIRFLCHIDNRQGRSMAETYLEDHDWHQLVAALTAVARNADDDPDLENTIKVTLSEIGDIWPASIQQQLTSAPVAAECRAQMTTKP